MNEDYQKWLARKQDCGNAQPWDFYMQVLTSGSWPLTQSPDFNLPQEVKKRVFYIACVLHLSEKIPTLFSA